jgi:hypothetical protein
MSTLHGESVTSAARPLVGVNLDLCLKLYEGFRNLELGVYCA